MTDTRLWPCSRATSLARGAAADTRQTADIAVDVASVGFWTKFESGTFTPWIPCRRSSTLEGSLNWSSQTTSLAINRRACAARRSPACVALRVRDVGENTSPIPEEPADAELQRVDHVAMLAPQRAGLVERLGRLDELHLLLGETVEGRARPGGCRA